MGGTVEGRNERPEIANAQFLFSLWSLAVPSLPCIMLSRTAGLLSRSLSKATTSTSKVAKKRNFAGAVCSSHIFGASRLSGIHFLTLPPILLPCVPSSLFLHIFTSLESSTMSPLPLLISPKRRHFIGTCSAARCPPLRYRLALPSNLWPSSVSPMSYLSFPIPCLTQKSL